MKLIKLIIEDAYVLMTMLPTAFRMLFQATKEHIMRKRRR